MTVVSGQLTKNFSAREFKCKDSSEVPIELKANLMKLATNLQVLRDYLGKSITITSGYRSPSHNKKIKGAKFSQHMNATAADIKVDGITPKQVAAAIEKLILENRIVQGGIGIYPSWVHYDVRGTKARW
jgi:uncharacterized protein YcbK (DUF882 family)